MRICCIHFTVFLVLILPVQASHQQDYDYFDVDHIIELKTQDRSPKSTNFNDTDYDFFDVTRIIELKTKHDATKDQTINSITPA